jgi:hypothetical protein
VLLVAASAIPAAVVAQQRYSWELSGLERSSNTYDFDAATIAATYYFDRVEDGEGPYALAAFFDPATLVSAALSHPSNNTDSWTVNGRYLLGESLWYVGGELTQYHYSNADLDADVYGVIAGKYLGPRTTLELALDRSKSDLTTTVDGCSLPACPFVSFTTTAETQTARLSLVHVRQFRSLTYALAGSFEQRDADLTIVDNGSVPPLNLVQGDSSPLRTYSVGATLYPTKKLGVRVGYEDTTNSAFDDYTDGTYSLGAQWFFRPKVAFELSLSRTDFNDPLAPYDDNELRSFRIVGRF